MKVEVEVDDAELYRKVLLDDWRMVKEDIKRLKQEAKVRGLEEFEKQDMKYWKKYRKAMETLITYYFTYDEYTKILEKGKNSD